MFLFQLPWGGVLLTSGLWCVMIPLHERSCLLNVLIEKTLETYDPTFHRARRPFLRETPVFWNLTGQPAYGNQTHKITCVETSNLLSSAAPYVNCAPRDVMFPRKWLGLSFILQYLEMQKKRKDVCVSVCVGGHVHKQLCAHPHKYYGIDTFHIRCPHLLTSPSCLLSTCATVIFHSEKCSQPKRA